MAYARMCIGLTLAYAPESAAGPPVQGGGGLKGVPGKVFWSCLSLPEALPAQRIMGLSN